MLKKFKLVLIWYQIEKKVVDQFNAVILFSQEWVENIKIASDFNGTNEGYFTYVIHT